jgi:hypothetical protein
MAAVRAGSAVGAASGPWSVQVHGMWCTMHPDGTAVRQQGWKLHVAATPATAATVLTRVLAVLVPQRVSLKFAATVGGVRWLTSISVPRSQAGKFLTVYPADDEQFRRLAAELDGATAGLFGPDILSDRRYRPGSLVHYRYGGFTGASMLDDDGCYRPVLVTPSGEVEEDRREAWFTPPAWAPPAFPAPAFPDPASPGPAFRDPAFPDPALPVSVVPAARASADARTPRSAAVVPAASVVSAVPAGPPEPPPAGSPRAVLIDGRFLVLRAMRHSSRGGVFEGRDEQTGAGVVVKQARAYIDVDPSGWDGRDRLRREAVLLGRLAPRGLAPRQIAVIDRGEHVFLVREPVEGVTVRQWVSDRAAGGGVPTDAGLRLAGRLVRLVESVHRAGLVLVDVSPNNIIVHPDGSLWLIDVDHAVVPGTPVYPVGTPGYTPPEHWFPEERAVAARRTADRYGLGGLLFLIAVGTDPVLADDSLPARPNQARIRAWLDAAAQRPLAGLLTAPILGLMRSAPDSRWRLERVQRFLDRPQLRTTPSVRRPDLAAVDQVIADGLAWLLEPHETARRRWPSGRFGSTTDPVAVQHGVAGVLGTLIRGLPHAAEPARVRTVVELAAGWIETRLATERVLPGLYFGRSGTAWALHEAAGLLGDERLAAVALDLAARTAIEWLGAGVPPGNGVPPGGGVLASPDVAHGIAGLGTAHLHLWRATGDPRFAASAREAAAELVRRVHRDGSMVSWPIPAGLRSTLAGRAYLGYAHGTAGVGAYLLAAAGSVATSWQPVELAVEAAQTLVGLADRRGEAAYWPAEPGGPSSGAGWCTGSAGIGAFLLRAGQVTGDGRMIDLARAAAAAGWLERGRLSTAACHGLAGVGQLLLDLADALHDPVYREQAEDVAQVLVARSVRRAGRLLVPDETGVAVVADQAVGLAGTLDFLIRLRHGGPRPWSVPYGPGSR